MRFFPTPPMKRLAALGLSIPLLFSFAPLASAANFLNGENLALTVPVKDDVYAGGAKVSISKNIDGDLVVAGSDLAITSTIAQSVFAAGGDITISGNIGHSVRVAGGKVHVSGKINGDLIVAGGDIIIENNAVIGRDLYIAGGTVEVMGKIARNVDIRGGEVSFGGTAGGTFTAKTDKLTMNGRVQGVATLSAPTMVIADGAHFASNVHFWQVGAAPSFDKKMATGKTATADATLEPMHNIDGKNVGAFFSLVAIGVLFLALLSSLFILLVLVLLTERFFVDTAETLKNAPWWQLLYGLMFLILAPIVSVILMASGFGFPVGLLLFFMYGFTLFFLTAITALTLTMWARDYYKKSWGKPMIFLISALILIVLKIVVFIPVIGWLARFVLMTMVLGAYLNTKWSKWKKIA